MQTIIIIRTVCTSKDTLERQVATIESYAAENALTLNASKCEIAIVSSQKATSSVVYSIAGQPLQPSSSSRCLGYWWSWDLSADASIDVAISKARKCFFAFGSMGKVRLVHSLAGRFLSNV